MKKMIICSGVPGAGKSTACEQFAIEYGKDAIVCPDTIREMCGAIIYDDDGNPIGISQDVNTVVFNIFYKIVEARMVNGATIVCDGTFVNGKTLTRLHELADQYGYEVELHRFPCDIETLKERNRHRGYKNVPDFVIEGMYKRFNAYAPEDWYKLVVHNQ